MATGATPTQEYGGYEYEFVQTPPERVLCLICKYPCRDPYMTLCCGYAFCGSCLDGQKQAKSISYACPMCREEEPGFKTVPYKALDREIRSLHIHCTNREKGCDWQGELNDSNNHLGNSDGCQFEGVKCSNECGKMIERRYLTSHVETECPHRKVNCQYCHDTGDHQFIEGQHKEECPKLSLSCPNKCEIESVPREDMEAHRKECPLEMIQCEYHNVGCEVMIVRKDLEAHKMKQMEQHWMMMTQTILSMPKSFDNQTGKKFNQSLVATDLSTKLSMAVTKESMHADESNSGNMSSITTKEPTFATKHDLSMTMVSHEVTDKVLSDSKPSTTVDEFIEPQKETVPTEDELSAPKKSLTIQNELISIKKHLSTINTELLAIKEEVSAVKKANQEVGALKNATSELYQKVKITEQSVEILANKFSAINGDKQLEKLNALEATLNCVTDRLDPWALRLCTTSSNGICPVVVMIPNIDSKKRQNVKWCSDPFYTHDKMYRMRLYVIINGMCQFEGTHVSVFLYLMKGQYDGRLQKPLVGNFVITLLNQKMDDNHYSVRFTEMIAFSMSTTVSQNWPDEAIHAAIGCNDFVSHEDLGKANPAYQYLKDDCIFIKVEAIYIPENPQPRPSIIQY